MKGLEGSKLGRYELRYRVAQGGMSEVYLGYDRRVRRYVAVKVLYGSDEPFVRRFEREALAVGALSHDHILPLYDFGQERPWYYLVMPFVEGGTLRDYLTRRERLTLEEAGSFLEQIASALQYAHDHGVVHRDVKPSNILLRPDGHAYLADFGLAKAKLSAEFWTHSGAMIGTPEYMAPEQSNGQNDNRSDIYSLGIILYQMLTGHVPFMAESPVGVLLKHIQTLPQSPRQLNNAIPDTIENIMLKALAKAPEERYQEAMSLALDYKKSIFQEHTRSLEEDLQALSNTEEKEAVLFAQKAEATIAAIEQMTSKLDLPSTKPQLFPLEGDSSCISYPTEMQKKHRRIRPYHVILLGLLIMSCMAVPLSILWQQSFATNSNLARPPLDPLSKWTTATERAQLNTQATLAAQAQVKATAGIASTIDTGKMLYYNDMTSKSSGWIDDGSQCYFSPQGYHVSTGIAHAVAWCYSNQQKFSNFIITTQARLLYGDFCGIVFRLNPYTKSFYTLEINSQGEYRLQRAQGNDPNLWLTLIDWTHSYSISNGYNRTNTFLVIATSNHFRFYINQQLIISTFIDYSYTTGLIGLLVGGDSINGTEAIFRHVAVFQKK